MEILLCRRATVGIHLPHSIYHALQGTERHDGDVDGGDAAHGLLCKGILSDDHRQKPPYDDGRHDVAGGIQHATRKEHIVPLRMRAARDADNDGDGHMQAQPVGHEGKEGSKRGHDAQSGCLRSAT